MLITGPLEKAKLYIESQKKIPEDSVHKRQEKSGGACITISRQAGAGADKISSLLAEYLHQYQLPEAPQYTVFDKNLIEKVLDDYNLPNTLLQLMEEKKYSPIASIANEFFSGSPGIWNLVHKTSNTIYQLAQLGNVIIVGRGSNFITAKLKNVFHVRLVAPIENRIKHIQDIFNMEKKEAEYYLKREDIDRRNYAKTYFSKDIEDPTLYHLVINTGKTSYETSAELMGDAVRKKFPNLFSPPKEIFNLQ